MSLCLFQMRQHALTLVDLLCFCGAFVCFILCDGGVVHLDLKNAPKNIVLADMADDEVFSMSWDEDTFKEYLGVRLLNAARKNDHNRINMLLYKGADPEYTDNDGENALLKLCKHKDADALAVCALGRKSSADCYDFVADRFTIDWACHNGFYDFVIVDLFNKLVKTQGNDALSYVGDKVLDFAIDDRCAELCHGLIVAGYDIDDLPASKVTKLKDLLLKHLVSQGKSKRENSTANVEEENEDEDEDEEGSDDDNAPQEVIEVEDYSDEEEEEEEDSSSV